MSRSVLEPCSCGSKRRRLIYGLNAVNQNVYYVRCPDCGAETIPDRIKEKAIHKWNMRVKNAREAAEE